MDLLKKILSGKDPEKRKMGMCHTFLTGKLESFLSPPNNGRIVMLERKKLELYHPLSTSYFYSFLHGHNSPTIRIISVPVSFVNYQVIC